METPRLPSESRAELADWPGLDGLVMRMLAKNRDDRPQDAEVLSELDDLRSGLVQRRTEQTAEYAHAPTVIERDWGHREQAVAAFTQPAPQPFTQPVSQPFTQLITQPAPPIEKREAGKIPVWIWGALAIVVVLAVATGFAAVRFYAPKPQSEFSQSLNPSVADKARETKAQVDSAAVNVNKRSCDLGSAAGCLELGNVYRDGVGVTADTAKAAQFYSRAKELFQKDCKEGDQASCSSLKSLQPPNSLNSANDKPASPKEQNSTQANNTKPSIVLPNVVLPKQVILPQFVKPPVPQPSTADLTQQALSFYGQKRFSEASPLFDKACMGGGWEACKDLGIMYRYGQGIPEDDNKAAGLFAKACDAGNALGCTNLGALYANGKGVDKDDTRAAAFYNRACDAGDAMGCSNLGTLYWDGRGVPHNDSQAAALYSKACDKGNAAACSNLGNGYLLGRGVAKNTDQARQLYMKSCGMNNKLACDQLKALK
jgi:TPR repeat protein